MFTVERTDAGYRATDAAKQSVVIGGEFAPASRGPPLPRGVDETVSARATRLELPPALMVVEDLDTGETREIGNGDGPVDLGEGTYCVRVNAPVLTYLRFDGEAAVNTRDESVTAVDFGGARPVTLGFRSRLKSPRSELHVPRTVEGVATALSATAGSHRTSSPDRSFPTMREHPPELTFVDPEAGEAVVPGHLQNAGDDVELVVPPDLEYLVTGASLAHYLGAEVTLEPDATPTLVAERRHELPPTPEFARAAGDLLQRVFYLDCLVRNVGPHGTDLAERSALDRLAFDPEAVYEGSVAERVETYLACDYERVADDLPEWHLSMYVEPSFERVRALPYVLYNVPRLFLPESAPLEDEEWLSRSLGDFYRGVRESVSVDLREPALGSGRTHGWLADGAPIDVYKALLPAYEHRERYRERDGAGLSIVAVVNDTDMGLEASEAADAYRRRVDDLAVDATVTVREQLSSDELAATLAAGHDMVHFVGHCEPAGLVCSDGHLAAADLAASNAETFFLNACGSYYEGLDLVRKGSVAGGVTFNRVLDDNAALVGTAFARLLAHGFSIERAMDLARRRVMAGKDYAVVGDGTHTLMQAEEDIADHVRLEQVEEGTFRAVHVAEITDRQGGVFHSYLGDRRPCLKGNEQEFRIDRERLPELLEYGVFPVIYDGDLRWSDELDAEL